MSLADDARWWADKLTVGYFGESHHHNSVALLTSCADELDRLNKRLETSPDHPFDGIECRDESIKMLERELAAAKRDSEWQPIKTAPKDGTEIIGMYVHIDTQIVHNVFWMGEDNTDENDVADIGWWTYDHSEVSRMKLEGWMTPTHWKPLPAPPDATIAEQDPNK